MNIMPFLMDFTETFSDMMNYENEYDDDFGFLVYPHEIHRRVHRPARLQMYSTRRLPYNVGGVKNLTTPSITKSKIDIEKNGAINSSNYSTIGKNGFQVCMNVQQFKPNELTVKMIDNTVIVDGKHDEREDENCLISRQFTRKYNLPKGYDPNDVISTLSSDGILTIKSPLPVKIQDCAERIVQIQHTGPAYLSVKDNPKVTTITTTTTIPIVTNNVNPTTNNLMMNSNKNSTSNMNSPIPIINNNNNNNSNSTLTTTTTTTNNNNNNINNNNAVETKNTTNPDVPTIIIQKEKNDNVAVIKEKCENGEKSENDNKIIEQSNEAIIED